jgi:hypothetical protein
MIYLFLMKNRGNLKDESMMKKYGSAYLNVDTNRSSALAFTSIFFGRRLALSMTVIFLQDVPSLQIICLHLSSLLIIIYVVEVKPLTSVYLNVVEILNEFLFFSCTTIVIALTDSGPQTETSEGR